MGRDSLKYPAIELGLHHNAIHVMKISCKARYEYISSINPDDFVSSYRSYLQEMEEAKDQLTDIYYYLSDHSGVFGFGTFLSKKGIYVNANSFGTTIGKKIFSSKEGFGSHRGYMKVKEVLNVFGEYMSGESMEGKNEDTAQRISA